MNRSPLTETTPTAASGLTGSGLTGSGLASSGLAGPAESNAVEARAEKAFLGRTSARPATGGILDRLARRLVLARLEKLQEGVLHLEEDGWRRTFGQPASGQPTKGQPTKGQPTKGQPTLGQPASGQPADGHSASSPSLEATLCVRHPRFYRQVALGGSIGAGEAYRDGYWESDDLTAVVRILAVNRAALEGLETGLAWVAKPLRQLGHWGRRNSKTGSRRNIRDHYDLGNEFYSLFLDPTMMYSCAVFDDRAAALADRAEKAEKAGKTETAEAPEKAWAAALERASREKLDLICRKLELGPNDRVLEIGTGWGGFALHAASRYGCHVRTTTISRRQYEFARQRVAQAGLEDRVEVLLEDYRELQGRYDKVVSIEMIEAVGEKYLDRFFEVCNARLEDHGMMLLQAIVIGDQIYDQYRRGVDFIQRHIFPGSFLPSVGAITERLGRVTDLRLFHLQDLTPHYATTLRLWRQRFLGQSEALESLGFDQRFRRLWEFYFRYCEGGFEERVIGDVQMLLTKPRCRRATLAV